MRPDRQESNGELLLKRAYQVACLFACHDGDAQEMQQLNLKSASFVVIMLLHGGLTHIQYQIKPRLLFGESFALSLTLSSFLKVSTGHKWLDLELSTCDLITKDAC